MKHWQGNIRKFMWLISTVTTISGILSYLFWIGVLRINTPSHTDFPVRGIDVSHHQNSIDWSKVKAAGLLFAYIKATEGSDHQDRLFHENWRGSFAVGLARGAYHFFTLCRPGDLQAKNFISTVPKEPQLPPVIDLEFGGNCSERPSANDFTVELQAFLLQVDNHFRKQTIIYTTYEFMNVYLKKEFLNRPLWIRDIFLSPRLQLGERWLFWQHHNRGRVTGINGPVDLNVFRGSAVEFRNLYD